MRNITKQDLLEIYEMMWRIRKFELRLYDLQMQGYIGGSIHTYVGEEAIGATVGHILNRDDYICSTHRGHGHVLGKGISTKAAMAEILGKIDGSCRGKGGSMHIADLDLGIVGANGIVGGGIPTAMGVGFSINYQKQQQVSIGFFGDGAANQGTFHESMNMAALYNLPVIFICENNFFGMTVPIEHSTKEPNIYKRAEGYGMYGEQVDGNDVFQVWEAMDKALERARDAASDNRPSLLEMRTYRHRGHWEGDPQVYRSQEEVNQWKETHDPIMMLEKRLMDDYDVSKAVLSSIEKNMDEEIAEAERFAIDSPYPDPSILMEDVYTETNQEV